MTCPICFTYDCNQVEDTDLYNLESELFPWVLDCPPGFDCQQTTQFNIVCCGQLLSTAIPAGADLETRLGLIRDVLKQCYVRDLFCAGGPPPPFLPPNPPSGTLYLNDPQSYTVFCPDGSPFTYFVPAGWFADATRAQANTAALNYAKGQALLRRMCLSSITANACKDSHYSSTITVKGGLSPFHFSIGSGSLPDGISLTATSPTTALLSGTPTTGGSFTFSVVANDNFGDVTQKTYTICVIDISPNTLPDATQYVPYSQALTATGCATPPLSWQVTSGFLPTGLTLDETTGIISGTPTGNGTFNFTITLQTEAT